MTHAAKPEHMPWLSPYLAVQDVQKAIDFYQNAFGFEVTDEVMTDPQSGEPVHAALAYKDTLFMIGKEGMDGWPAQSPATAKQIPAMNLYIYSDDVDELFSHATQHGAKKLLEPTNQPWGDRMCSLQDLDGHHWNFATYLAS